MKFSIMRYLHVALLGVALSGCGDDPPYHEEVWSKAFDPPEFNSGEGCGTDVAVDSQGNIIVLGNYKNSLIIGGDPLPDPWDDAYFLAMYDPSGYHLWSKQLTTGDNKWPHVAADSEGNIIVAGLVSNDAKLFGTTIDQIGSSDGFVAKVSPDGSLLWSNHFSGPFAKVKINNLAIDDLNNITIVGSFRRSVSFGPNTLQAAGGSDGFVAQLGPDGAFNWSHRSGNEKDFDGIFDLTIGPDGAVVVYGSHIDPGRDPDSEGRLYQVAMFSQDGDFLESWNQEIGPFVWHDGALIAVTNEATVQSWIGGTPINPDSEKDPQLVLARLQPGQAPTWTRELGNIDLKTSSDLKDLAVDGQGRIHLLGNSRHVRVSSFGPDGKELGSSVALQSNGGTISGGLAIDSNDNIVVTGCTHDDKLLFSGDPYPFILKTTAP